MSMEELTVVGAVVAARDSGYDMVGLDQLVQVHEE
jgi:hypothetical protein